MTPKGYVCWDADLGDRILNVDAVVPNDATLLATHEPAIFRRRPSGATMGEREFLAEFISPSRPHMHAVVVGPNGCGKSHFVRWLALHVPPNETRKVVFVPRVGANLKDIVRRILAGMEGEAFDGYRKRLETATSDDSPELTRERLLDSLAQATGPHGPFTAKRRDGAADRDARELIADLTRVVPLVLRSHAVRSLLLRDDGILAKLADHVLGAGTSERRNEPMRIDEADFLPPSLDLVAFAEDERAAYLAYLDLRRDDDFLRAAVEWINENRDWAVAKLLDLSGDELNTLLLDVRRALKARGQELVLLIEDLAKTQGYDKALTEAMLVRPSAQDPDLCTMRTAFAVTPGYLPLNTVEQRIDLYVDMDVPARDLPATLRSFAGRYLNAMRLGEGPLASEDIPSKCDPCPFRTDCHAAFGAQEGHGLYPFTDRSLATMYRRAAGLHAGTADLKGFNPRVMVKDVLSRVLKGHRDEIGHVRHPSPRLLEEFGRPELPPEAQFQLEREFGFEEGARTRALFELYGDGRSLGGVPEGVFAAFGLRSPAGGSAPAPAPVAPPIPNGPAEPATDLRDAAFDDWSNGRPLPAYVLQKLTEDLAGWLWDTFPWDLKGLDRARYRRWFNSGSLSFPPPPKQTLREARIAIPLCESDRARTALALKGWTRFRSMGSWAFENGIAAYAAFADLQDDLHREMERQFRSVRLDGDGRAEFDPAPLAIHVLALAHLLAGRPRPSGLAESVATVLKLPKFGVGVEDRATPWQDLARALTTERMQSVLDLARGSLGASKGGAISMVIDASLLSKPLRDAYRTPLALPEVPNKVPLEYQELAVCRRALAERLEAAVEAEEASFRENARALVTALGPGLDARSAAAQAREVLGAGGSVVRSLPDDAIRRLEGWRNPRPERVESVLRELDDAADIGGRLVALAANDSPAQVRRLVVEVGFLQKELSAIEGRLEATIEDFGGAERSLIERATAIQSGYDAILASIVGREEAAVGP